MALSNTWKEKYARPVKIKTSFQIIIDWLMDQRPPPTVARTVVHKMITTCEKVSSPAGSQEQESCYLFDWRNKATVVVWEAKAELKANQFDAIIQNCRSKVKISFKKFHFLPLWHYLCFHSFSPCLRTSSSNHSNKDNAWRKHQKLAWLKRACSKVRKTHQLPS